MADGAKGYAQSRGEVALCLPLTASQGRPPTLPWRPLCRVNMVSVGEMRVCRRITSEGYLGAASSKQIGSVAGSGDDVGQVSL